VVTVPKSESLTELEGAVLGVLWQNGPCTPYRVRRVFLDSPSPYWSGSAGAIYPLMLRLERRGLIASREGPAGRRASRLYALAAAGVREFRAWLEPPWPAVVTGVPADPLRTRVSFLGALPASSRSRFLKEAIGRIDPDIREHEKDRRRGRHAGNPFEAAVARGALAALRARRRWLAETARVFGRKGRRR
jgi:DNA-binding PadR family transcriptional regulator